MVLKMMLLLLLLMMMMMMISVFVTTTTHMLEIKGMMGMTRMTMKTGIVTVMDQEEEEDVEEEETTIMTMMVTVMLMMTRINIMERIGMMMMMMTTKIIDNFNHSCHAVLLPQANQLLSSNGIVEEHPQGQKVKLQGCPRLEVTINNSELPKSKLGSLKHDQDKPCKSSEPDAGRLGLGMVDLGAAVHVAYICQ